MIEMEFKVDAEGFEEWLFSLHHRFLDMVQTMIDIHYLIQANTNQRVPLDTGRLESSFRYDIVRQDEFFIEMHSIYSAIDPDSGFDYAYYQYDEDINLRWGGTNSLYDRARAGYPVGNHHRHGTRGQSLYLLRGVRASKNMMWTILEQDYLSLFYGGIK